MDWRKHVKNWKLICTVALIFALCGEGGAHVELLPAEYGPTTVSVLQVSGANTPNTSPGIISLRFHPWLSR